MPDFVIEERFMNITSKTPNQVDAAAIYIGENLGIAQANLMNAFATREGQPGAIQGLANLLNVAVDRQKVNNEGIPLWLVGGKEVPSKTQPAGGTPIMENVTPDLKGLQLIAEQRFQHASQVFSMFSNLLDKIDQMKQRLIQKFGQG
jgi:hypothetical protein